MEFSDAGLFKIKNAHCRSRIIILAPAVPSVIRTGRHTVGVSYVFPHQASGTRCKW